MYTYTAQLKEVIDGDTLDVLIDLGFETYVIKRIRLDKLNTPEKNTTAGQHAKAFVVKWFAENAGPYVIFTVKDRTEKYGRYLASVVTTGKADNPGKSLVADIISAGLGMPWDGKGPKPLPPDPPAVQ